MWKLFFFLSASVLVVSLITTILLAQKNNKKTKPLYWLVGGVFVSTVLLLYPILKISFDGNYGSTFEAIIISMHNAIQFFTADSDFGIISGNAENLSGWIKPAYSLLGTVLIILAPILTFGFLLSFFKGVTARLKHIMHLPADSYIFSEINTKSVSLAQSIRKKDKKAIIVFSKASVEDEIDSELIGGAREIKSILYKKQITDIIIPWKPFSKKVLVFAINESESQSISDTLQLIKKHNNRKNTEIYLFSCSMESELMLNNTDKGSLIVRRINPIRSLLNYILLNDGNQLFDSAKEDSNGEKEISAVVVGVGALGTEVLKSLAWYCQMDKYKLKLNAFDIKEDIKDQFTALCPEFIDEKHNGLVKDGEAFYKINIHSCNVKTETFKNAIRQIKNVTYVFISLGDDSLNVDTAVNMRILFEQMHIHPSITTIVSDSEKKAALFDAKDRNNKSFDINFIGDDKTIYSDDVIINSELEKEALELHKRYNNGNPLGFYEYEYNYKSSTASALHLKAREHCGISNDAVEELEHKRWNAYMRSEGYIFSGSDNPETRNDLGRMHHNLVPFGELSKSDKDKDRRVGIKKE